MTRTFSKEIESDYNKVIESIGQYYKLRKFSFENLNIMFSLDSLKKNHRYYYFLRILHNDMNYKNKDTEIAIKDAFEGFYDYFWSLFNTRYKASIGSLRASMEMLIKSFIREIDPQYEKNNFSNNIERGIKKFREEKENTVPNKKKFTTFLQKNYTEQIVKLYGNLSNIVHGNYTASKDEFSDYLLEIMNIDINFNVQKIEQITNYTNEFLEIILELFIIVNYEELHKNINPNQFNIIYNSLNSSRFKEYKSKYFLQIYNNLQ